MAEQKDQAKREFLLAAVEAEGVGFVNLEFTDVVGMAKCVTIPVEQLPDCLIHGKWFDVICISFPILIHLPFCPADYVHMK